MCECTYIYIITKDKHKNSDCDTKKKKSVFHEQKAGSLLFLRFWEIVFLFSVSDTVPFDSFIIRPFSFIFHCKMSSSFLILFVCIILLFLKVPVGFFFLHFLDFANGMTMWSESGPNHTTNSIAKTKINILNFIHFGDIFISLKSYTVSNIIYTKLKNTK